MDSIDEQILKLLTEDSRLTHKEIGKAVHMSGQAVGVRINQMISKGIIEKYTIKQSFDDTQFIRLFLNGPYFKNIKDLSVQFKEIEDVYQTSGQACLIIISHFSNQRLKIFLCELSKYCRFTVEAKLN
ncbi:AsnC family protein [Staphylococcus condimenti]|uniref:Winged helix-turn-helix transcriptional regulator n=3 Tax=Staphylococcus condimenti TaxID=70255 RepID=A0AB37H0C1_9STAP|nr:MULTISPECIES: AsnC family transcriptional regulator [Staphylococcus]AMY06548.1 hypothetical protein A4G25_11630 [Staphylococcus condimenti]APR60429.1 hypothetical protein BTZ13_04050 [Staphylococcus condimenti]MDK8645937.1 winged helix-turn-helix transcriptional regulator [Staphylococcus condimenti]OFP00594.1 hypothetical protein HMPREF3007_04915 [Staphylococcus sp. HMSC065E08]PNZ62211.1 AsnC family protein [Staphylococcus condimenti]